MITTKGNQNEEEMKISKYVQKERNITYNVFNLQYGNYRFPQSWPCKFICSADISHMLSEQDLENQACIILSAHLPLHTRNLSEGDGISAAFIMQFSNTHNRCIAMHD